MTGSHLCQQVEDEGEGSRAAISSIFRLLLSAFWALPRGIIAIFHYCVSLFHNSIRGEGGVKSRPLTRRAPPPWGALAQLLIKLLPPPPQLCLMKRFIVLAFMAGKVYNKGPLPQHHPSRLSRFLPPSGPHFRFITEQVQGGPSLIGMFYFFITNQEEVFKNKSFGGFAT